MRIDARVKNYGKWTVYHVEQCRVLKMVVWVDDETHQYGQDDGSCVIQTVQAHIVQIIPQIQMVLINPIADTDSAYQHHETEYSHGTH